MKRYLIPFLIPAAAAVLAVGCSDDENITAPRLSLDETSAVLGRDQVKATFRLNATSAWSAEKPADAKWLSLREKEGTGNSTLTFFVDDNWSGSERSADITVRATADPEKKVVYTVRQSTLSDLPENNDVSADRGQEMTFSSKGLGQTLSMATGKISGEAVVSLAKLKDCIERGAAKPEVYLQDTYPEIKISGAEYDSILTKTDTLGVKLNLHVQYSKFSFDIGGAYKSAEHNDAAHSYYNFGFTADNSSASLGAATLAALGSTQDIFSEGFKEAIDWYKDCATDAERDEALEYIDDVFGPFFVSGVTLGGEFMLNLTVDNQAIDESLHIDGKAKLGITLGMGSVDADVEAVYEKDGIEMLYNSDFRLEATGGDVNKALDVLAYLNSGNHTGDTSGTGASGIRKDEIVRLEQQYAASITPDNSVVTAYTVTPIWHLIPMRYMNYAKRWFVTKYKGSTTLCEPYRSWFINDANGSLLFK